MKYTTSNSRTMMRLERGGDVIKIVTQFAKEKGWRSGTIMGIGAFKDTVLGYYDLAQQTYLKKTIPGICELVSLQGNLSRVEGEPLFHMHVVIADREFQCFGGHLFSATVGVTTELIFDEIDLNVIRSIQDEAVALKLLDFSHCKAS